MKINCFKFVRFVISASILAVGLTVTGAVYAAPSAPGNVYAKGISSSEIGVNWQKVANAEGYYVYRSTTETGTYEKIRTITGLDSTYFGDRDADYAVPEVQPIGASEEYYYKVSSYDSTGESPLSEVVTHTYTDKTGQSVTVALSKGKTMTAKPLNGITVTDNHNMTVTVKWLAAKEPNVTGYNVYRSDTSGGVPVKVNAAPITVLEYADSVVFNKDYFYTVAAIDDKNLVGRRSQELWIKPEAQPGANLPHSKFQQDAKECAYCHNTHSSSGQDLITKVSESEACFVCHDGTGSKNATYLEFNGTYPSKHPLGQNGLSCASCHDAHLDSTAVDLDGSRLYPSILRPVSVDGNMTYKGNEQCYKCHGVGSTLKGGNHKTAFENSVHNLNMPNPASGTDIKCSACHEPHAGPNANLKSYKDENQCFSCHNPNAAGTAVPDIYSRLASGGEQGSRHDVLEADRQESGAELQCVNCHNSHGVTDTNKIVDPDNPAPGSLWTGTQKDFCLKCHDGTLPTSTQTLPYAPGVNSGEKTLPDINEAYYLGTDLAADMHGEGDGQPASLDITMGYDNSAAAPNYMLDCSTCHQAHGSANRYNLKSAIASVDGTKTKGGLWTYSWDYQDSTGAAVRGVDTRFFCSSCHVGSTHIESQSFPTDCLTCHKHGGKF